MKKIFVVIFLLTLPRLAVAQQASPAPQLGHPLDPADVAILTGKARGAAAPSGAAVPPVYYGYPVGVPLFSQSVFAPVSTATHPPFAPVLFGRIRDKSFVVVGGSPGLRLLPSFVFFGGRASPVFFGPGFPFVRR